MGMLGDKDALVDEQKGDMMVDLTSEIICSYVANNSIPVDDLPKLIGQIHATLVSISGAQQKTVQEPQKPAVSIKRSITPDYLVCLEDGQKFKSLKRHLRSKYNLSPDEYRAKWRLPSDYPMVAPNYAAARSQLAMKMGLGQKNSRNK
ncbi:MAG: MucR family transcriptional regulator [Hyphomicrobiales bacterium]